MRPSGRVLPQKGQPSGTGTLSRELIAAGVCWSAPISSPDGAGDKGNVALIPAGAGIPDTAAPEATAPDAIPPAPIAPDAAAAGDEVAGSDADPADEAPVDDMTADETVPAEVAGAVV